MEYWSIGVMLENRNTGYNLYYKVHSDLFICFEKVIGQNQFR
jgi:hypothetical protein